MNDSRNASAAAQLGRSLRRNVIRRFWSEAEGVFVVNLPWLSEEKNRRLCDRSLATAILFDQCPGGRQAAAVRALAECPASMGFSYPANAIWRLWALGKAGRADIILKDLRERWATMDSVRLNNTVQEDWRAQPDSGAQWSHCAVGPLLTLFMNLAGLRPLAPGFQRCEIRPQLFDLEEVDLTAHTVRGPIAFRAAGRRGQRQLSVTLPADCQGELVIPREEKVALSPCSGASPQGCLRYLLPAGKTTELQLRYL